MTRLKHRIPFTISCIMVGLVAAAACTPADVTATLAAAKDKAGATAAPATGTPKPSGNNLGGSLEDTGGGTVATATPAGTGGSGGGATATPAATATPNASPTATSAPYKAFSVEVVVTPSTASINLRDPEGQGGANYPATVVLSADVLFSDNSHSSTVTWSTSNSQIADVSPAGVVSSGTKTGIATITATSQDDQSSGACRVTVKDDAALDVTID